MQLYAAIISDEVIDAVRVFSKPELAIDWARRTLAANTTSTKYHGFDVRVEEREIEGTLWWAHVAGACATISASAWVEEVTLDQE